MPKTAKVIYFCNACGYESSGWLGQCSRCGTWNSMEEVPVKLAQALNAATAAVQSGGQPVTLSAVDTRELPRFSTGFGEMDRVLGGGVVPGSLVLIGGDPGIGKSTLLLQAAAKIADQASVLYVTGEESPAQVRMRAERIGAVHDKIMLYPQTDVEQVEAMVAQFRPQLLIVDSIQTLYNPALPGMPGSISQLREGATRMMRLAKHSGCAVALIGHVNKEGGIAGPRVLEHVVDTVLYLEGDHAMRYRILRAVKNRFGSTNEIGLFEMHDNGLIQVENPSEMLVSPRAQEEPGSVICCTMEGTRAMLVEIQGLVCPTNFGTPRRMCAGFDVNRMAMLLAVLEKRVGLAFGNHDAYLNVAGGLKLTEPAADLGVLMGVASSQLGRPAGAGTAMFGEVGLTGEIRPVSHPSARVAECVKLGVKRLILPSDNLKDIKTKPDMQLVGVQSVKEALAAVFKNKNP